MRNAAKPTQRREPPSRSWRDLSYSVSHDLRAPLRAVDGFSQILQNDHAGKFDAEGQRIVNLVRDGVARMNCMIEDILAFSRSSTVELKPVPVDMAELAPHAR